MADINAAFDGKNPEVVLSTVGAFLDAFLKDNGLESHRVVEGFKAGNTAAQSMGLTREDLEVIYAMGFQQLNAGEPAKAQDVFTVLSLIDPLEAKNHYCLALCHQMQGKAQVASEMYINFLALDATNPAGYLRYGECLLALGEKGEALEAFDCAEAEAAKGNGSPGALEEARSKIEILKKETVQ